MPDGKKRTFKNYDELEETYNELKNERTQLSAELGDLIKPVNEKKELMDSYLTDHMVNLTSAQLLNLQNGVESLSRLACSFEAALSACCMKSPAVFRLSFFL